MTKAARSGLLITIFLLIIAGATLASAQAPVVLFTDLTSGPNTGGESVSGYAGAYVTLYGNNFGTTQGASTVTWNGLNCLRVVSWGGTWRWYQKTVVQLGSSCTPGTGNFVVTVNGQSSTSAASFTVRSTGHLYFVSTSGSDSNSGSASSPWATVLKARNTMVAGDITYLENGVSQTADDGSGWQASMSVSTSGSSGSPIALVGYPGATATIGSLSGDNWGVRFAGGYNYWVFAELQLRANAIAIEGVGSYLYMIANDITCTNPEAEEAGCAMTSQSNYVYFYGNYVHNVGNPSQAKTEHAVYFTTDTNDVWMGWNEVANNSTCYAVQFHSSPTTSGTGMDQYDLHAFSNLIYVDGCAGIGFDTVNPSEGTVEAYNNVLYNLGVGGAGGDTAACLYGPGYTNTGTAGSGTVQFYNNTLYNCGVSSTTYVGGILVFGSNNPNLNYQLTNNIIYQASSEPYLAQDTSSLAQFTCSGRNNDFYGNGGIPSQCGSGNLNVNPQFTSTATPNFNLASGSPVIGAGSATLYPAMDFNGNPRPNPPSIGAFELASASTVQRPNPPTNLQVVVQ